MSKNIKISATRYNTFLACKQKYWFAYHDKLPKIENHSFKLGTAVHEALEFAGNIWKNKSADLENDYGVSFTDKEIKDILTKYNEISIREGIIDMDIHIEGKELILKRLDNFLTGQKLIGLETKFGFFGDNPGPQVSTKDGVPLMGAIDKIERYNEDTLLIIDYKTSKTAPTPDQLRTDPQLTMYNIVAKILYPQYKRIILALDLLKMGMVFTYRTPEELRDFEGYLKVMYDQMLNLKPENVKATLNMFCPWCDYKDYCSTYQRACKKSTYEFLPTVNYTEEQLVSEWQSVRSVKKILENREQELSMIITEKIRNEGKDIHGPTEDVGIRQNSRTNYDLDTVVSAVPSEDFPGLVTVNKKAVENYMKINPAVKEKIMASATTSYTTPFLTEKKKKKKIK